MLSDTERKENRFKTTLAVLLPGPRWKIKSKRLHADASHEFQHATKQQINKSTKDGLRTSASTPLERKYFPSTGPLGAG